MQPLKRMRWYFVLIGILKAYNVKSCREIYKQDLFVCKGCSMCLYIITVFLKGYSEMFIVVTLWEEYGRAG